MVQDCLDMHMGGGLVQNNARVEDFQQLYDRLSVSPSDYDSGLYMFATHDHMHASQAGIPGTVGVDLCN